MKRLTDRQYDAKLKKQNGGCGICGRKPKRGQRRYAHDHNHRTGLYRGLLCPTCNGRILGRAEKFAKWATLRQVVQYLEMYDPSNPLLG